MASIQAVASPVSSSSSSTLTNDSGKQNRPKDSEKETENVEPISPEDVELAVGLRADSVFRNTFHEMIFIFLITSAQFFTQANLGNVIFPLKSVSDALSVPTTARASWFVASYSCGVASGVLISGRLGDIFGRRKIFCLGFLWLAIFSLITGFMPGEISFDIVRALAGFGPSLMMPNAAGLLGAAWMGGGGKRDEKMKRLAFGIFGAIAPAGFMVAGAWASAVVQTGSRDWRWIFWSMAIVCAALTVASWFVIPEALDKGSGEGLREFDFLGSVLGVVGLVMVFCGINLGATHGWSEKPHTPAIVLILGIFVLVLFLVNSQYASHPILPLRIFKSRVFPITTLALGLGWMSFGTFQFYFPYFLTHFRGLTPAHASLQFLPAALAGVAAAALALFCLSRYSLNIIFAIAMACFLIGQIILALTPIDQTYWAMSFPTTIIICFGPDISFAVAAMVASDSVEERDQGVAGSWVNTVVNYCVALGLAVVGNVESAVGRNGGTELEGVRSAFWTAVGFAGVGMAVTLGFWKWLGGVHGKH